MPTNPEDPVQINEHVTTLDLRADQNAARALAFYATITHHLDPARSARIEDTANWHLPAPDPLYSRTQDWDGTLENLLTDQPVGSHPTGLELHQLENLLQTAPNSESATKLYLAVIPNLLPKLVTELLELRSRIGRTLVDVHRLAPAEEFGLAVDGDGPGLVCTKCDDEDLYEISGIPCATHDALDPEGVYRVNGDLL